MGESDLCEAYARGSATKITGCLLQAGRAGHDVRHTAGNANPRTRSRLYPNWTALS